MAPALRQLVQRGVIQLTLCHRGKDGRRFADRPAGTLHPAVADLNPVERAAADRKRLGGFLSGTLNRQLPGLRFQHRDTFPALQSRVGDFPEYRQTFALCHRQLIRAKQRPLAVDGGDFQVQTLSLTVFQGQHVAAGRHTVNDKAVMLPGLRVPPLHDHALTVIVPHAPTLAVQPHRRQRGHCHVPVAERPLIFEGVADNVIQDILLTRAADLRHALLPFTHADGELLRQPAVTHTFVRLADDVCRGLPAALPPVGVHAAVLQDCQRAPGSAALAAVGEQDLHVMAHGAIEQGNRLLQAQLLRLVDN